MAFVDINPAYRDFLTRHGLTDPGHFLGLPGVVVSGHPDRHVVRVEVGSGPDALRALLKREHRVPWKDRLGNAWAGFGLVSRSMREAALLKDLAQLGIGCPEWLAAGEDGRGRAFLLVRELTGFVDLRLALAGSPAERRRLARHLGEALAWLHAAGFDHPDLYAKHILIHPHNGSIRLLDWQRSRRWPCVPAWRRWHDLAALNATLADDLVSARDRLACLRAYVRAMAVGQDSNPDKSCQDWNPDPQGPWDRIPILSGLRQDRNPIPRSQTAGRSVMKEAVARIVKHTERLRQRRRIREQHQPPLALGTQNLVWLDGEALCVTREFQAALNGSVPRWLAEWHQPVGGWRSSQTVPIPSGHRATLVRRWVLQPLQPLWAWLRGRPAPSLEVQQAGLLFRLQRHGIGTPRLLAVGQRPTSPWKRASFLLTEGPVGVRLDDWLASRSRMTRWTAERKQHRQVIRAAAVVLRRLHAAGCAVGKVPLAERGGLFLVQPDALGQLAVVLSRVDGLRTRRRSGAVRPLQDLAKLREAVASAGCSRTDELRFFLAYLGLPRLTAVAKRQARQLGRRVRGVAR